MYDVDTDDQLWRIMALVVVCRQKFQLLDDEVDLPRLITAVVAVVVVFEAADGRFQGKAGRS